MPQFWRSMISNDRRRGTLSVPDPGRSEGTPSLRLLALLLVLGLAWGRPASATSAVLLSDEALVAAAPIIVVGYCEGQLPNTSELPVTDWLFTVERELKGSVSSGAFEVRVMEGEGATGTRVRLFGAPRFRKGKRALLFLEPQGGGRFRVLHLFQGAFHILTIDNRTVAIRDLSEVTFPTSPEEGSSAPGRRIRDFEAFDHWIADKVEGVPHEAGYFFRPTRRGIRAVRQAFKLYTHPNGLNFRWFEFDSGSSVPYRNNGTQPGIPGGGGNEFFAAMAAWNDDSRTRVNLTYTGETTANGGLRFRDQQNTILFGDPNDEIEGFDCSGGGGTLAIGGFFCSPCTAGSFGSKSFLRIQEGDIVVNNGIECVLAAQSNPSRYLQRLFGHELGHTLGIDHSSENQNESSSRLRNALMYYLILSNGVGARLESDDRAALEALYRSGGGPPPGPGACPLNTLCLLRGRFRVTASWRNQFDGSSGSAGTQKASDIAGYLYFTDPRNTELILKVVDFGTNVKVFWGQLTNLEYTITVTDTRNGTSKQYSNTPGNCGGFDDTGFPASLHAASRRGLTAMIRRASLAGTCRADADTMCLIGNRFAVEMTWRNQFDNTSGVGIPKRLSDLTGAFAFTDPQNLEILIKTLPFPDRILVIYGALSNLEYTLRVTDTVTGSVKTYENPAGRYCGGLDNAAFPP